MLNILFYTPESVGVMKVNDSVFYRNTLKPYIVEPVQQCKLSM